MWKAIMFSFSKVFRRVHFVALAIVVAAVVMAIILWLPNHELITYVFRSDQFDWGSRFVIIFTSLGLFRTNFPLTSQIILPTVAVLSGINVAMLVYEIRQRITERGGAGVGLIGLLVSMLGIGCSACGSVILSSFLGVATAMTLVTALPFGGVEFALLGIVVLVFSNAHLVRKIHRPSVCKIERTSRREHGLQRS